MATSWDGNLSYSWNGNEQLGAPTSSVPTGSIPWLYFSPRNRQVTTRGGGLPTVVEYHECTPDTLRLIQEDVDADNWVPEPHNQNGDRGRVQIFFYLPKPAVAEPAQVESTGDEKEEKKGMCR